MNGIRLYRINKLEYDSRITVTNHKLCQTGSVAESRLPRVTRTCGKLPTVADFGLT